MKNINDKLTPICPGEILKEEFMVPLGLTANQLALRLHVPSGRITSIINGQRSITSDTALRLSKFFGTSAEFWLNLQQLFDLQIVEETLGTRLDTEIIPFEKGVTLKRKAQ